MFAFRTRVVFAFALGALTAAAPVRAASYVVPDDYPTIQAALDASALGDEILVRPGSYGESLVYDGPVVTLWGLGEPNDVQVLPPSGRCLEVRGGAQILVRSMTFAAGLADSGGGALVRGNAIAVFESCVFTGNTSRGAGSNCSYGGALFVSAGAEVRCYDSKFSYNHVGNGTGPCLEGYGGALYIGAGGFAMAERSRFEHNVAAGFEGGWGGAVGCDGSSYFGTCAFDSNLAGVGGALAGSIGVSECTFFGNRGLWGASALHQTGDTQWISHCVFHDNDSWYSATVVLDGVSRVENNTFAWNLTSGFSPTSGCVQVGNPLAELRNNIVARNLGYFGISGVSPAAFGCNDVWGNEHGEYEPAFGDRTGIDDNISADPMFSDSAARIFTLRPNSPCRPQYPCRLIGALPVEGHNGGVDDVVAIDPAMKVSPNPMSDQARIAFRIGSAERVRLDIVDLAGRRIATLVDGILPAGVHERRWGGLDDRGGATAPGVYFVRLGVGSHRFDRSVVVLDRSRRR